VTPREIQRHARGESAINFETLQRSTEWKIKALKNQIRNLEWYIDNERHPSAYTNAARARLAQYRAQLVKITNSAPTKPTPEEVVRDTVRAYIDHLETRRQTKRTRALIQALRAQLAKESTN
jgi:hypothetical protein